MNIKNKALKILIEAIPIILMIILIPAIINDYVLTVLYILIMIVSFIIKYNKQEYIFFIFGFIVMVILEYFFISAGVEVFARNSLFGIMPIWLPFLWAYGFVAIKRAVVILDK